MKSNIPYMDDVIVEFAGVSKSFGTQEVHKDITLKIPRGKITYIVGPSGTGKSVLLKEMIGLIRPDKGSILLDGVDITKMSEKELLRLRRKFSLLFQQGALFDFMNVFDNVAFPLREHTKTPSSEIKAKVVKLLTKVGLKHAIYKMPGELSGGMKKRVALARAVILHPEILMYDEPVAGLDPIMSSVIDDLIYTTQQQYKITTVVVSHDIQSILTIPDYIYMLYKGYVVYQGTKDDIKTSDNPYIVQFINAKKDGPIEVA